MQSTPNPSSSDYVPLRLWLAILTTILGAFMAILDIQITNSSIREIAGSLSISLSKSNNIATAYLVAEMICIPITAWLVRWLSMRRLLIITTVIFVLSSLACSISWNLASMVVFRAIQGFSSAPLIPLALLMVTSSLPESKRMVGMALFGVTATFAPTIGPTLGGWLTDNFSWEYLFYINVIPGIIVIYLLLKTMDSEPVNKQAMRQIDIFSVITMALGLGVLEYVLENGSTYNWFSSSYILMLSVISFVSLILFFINDFYSEHPLLHIRILFKRKFGIGTIGYFFLGVTLYGSVFIVPLYLIEIQGYSAFQVGKVICWQGLPQLILMPVIPIVSKYIDKRVMVAIGYLLLAFSCFFSAYMSYNFSGPQTEISMIIRGIALPFVMVPLSSVIFEDMQRSDMAAASSITSVVRNLGGAFGIAFITTLITTGGNVNAGIISERLSSTNLAGWWRLFNYKQMLMQNGSDAYTASQQAHILLHQQLEKNGVIIAFNTVYFLLGITLVFCAVSMVMFYDFKKKNNSSAN